MSLDTNALSDLLEGRKEIRERIADAPSVEAPFIVLGEYRAGLRRSKRRERLEQALDEFLESVEVLPVTEATADEYATVVIHLERIGRPIPVNDIWIAALALQHGLPVLSRDTHFDIVPGVQRIGW